MTEELWNAKHELAQNKVALWQSQGALVQAQGQLVQIEFLKAKAELEALGDKWAEPHNVVELKEAGKT